MLNKPWQIYHLPDQRNDIVFTIYKEMNRTAHTHTLLCTTLTKPSQY